MENFNITMLKFLKLSHLASTCESPCHNVVTGNVKACSTPINCEDTGSFIKDFSAEMQKLLPSMAGGTNQKTLRIIGRFIHYPGGPKSLRYPSGWFILLPGGVPTPLTNDSTGGGYFPLVCFSSGAQLCPVESLSRNRNPQQFSHFYIKYKLASESHYDSGIAEPLTCKGLFTTNHAKKHRLPDKHFKNAKGEQLAPHAYSSMHIDLPDGLPDRNSESSLIGVGLVPSLRTLYHTLTKYIMTMAMPVPLNILGVPETLTCKGLFTTTRAKKHRLPDKHFKNAKGEQSAPHACGYINIDLPDGLPDRNSESSLIGVGLVPSLRTLYHTLTKYIKTMAMTVPLNIFGIPETLICMGWFTTTQAIKTAHARHDYYDC